MDRRVLFFVAAAAACVLLVPLAPTQFRWVCWSVAVVYLLLAAGSGLDTRTRRRASRHPADPEE